MQLKIKAEKLILHILYITVALHFVSIYHDRNFLAIYIFSVFHMFIVLPHQTYKFATLQKQKV